MHINRITFTSPHLTHTHAPTYPHEHKYGQYSPPKREEYQAAIQYSSPLDIPLLDPN